MYYKLQVHEQDEVSVFIYIAMIYTVQILIINKFVKRAYRKYEKRYWTNVYSINTAELQGKLNII